MTPAAEAVRTTRRAARVGRLAPDVGRARASKGEQRRAKARARRFSPQGSRGRTVAGLRSNRARALIEPNRIATSWYGSRRIAIDPCWHYDRTAPELWLSRNRPQDSDRSRSTVTDRSRSRSMATDGGGAQPTATARPPSRSRPPTVLSVSCSARRFRSIVRARRRVRAPRATRRTASRRLCRRRSPGCPSACAGHSSRPACRARPASTSTARTGGGGSARRGASSAGEPGLREAARELRQEAFADDERRAVAHECGASRARRRAHSGARSRRADRPASAARTRTAHGRSRDRRTGCARAEGCRSPSAASTAFRARARRRDAARGHARLRIKAHHDFANPDRRIGLDAEQRRVGGAGGRVALIDGFERVFAQCAQSFRQRARREEPVDLAFGKRCGGWRDQQLEVFMMCWPRSAKRRSIQGTPRPAAGGRLTRRPPASARAGGRDSRAARAGSLRRMR